MNFLFLHYTENSLPWLCIRCDASTIFLCFSFGLNFASNIEEISEGTLSVSIFCQPASSTLFVKMYIHACKLEILIVQLLASCRINVYINNPGHMTKMVDMLDWTGVHRQIFYQNLYS